MKGTTIKIIGQEGEFLNFLRPVKAAAGLPLMKTVLATLAKVVLIPLRLTAVVSAADAAIQKKIYWSGRSSDLAPRTKALIISNEKINNIIKIVKSLEESDLLIKGVSKIIKN